MKRFLLLAVVWFSAWGEVRCQSAIGIPSIRSYTSADYHASIEAWDIGQDKRGVLYFANNDGLLTFDGSYWKTYPMPNKVTIKSLAVDRENWVFVGGTDEIGYFSPGARGILTYHSLKEELPKEARQFADVWDIVFAGDEVFFRTNESIMVWGGGRGRMRTFDAPRAWQMLALAGSEMFAADKENGLYQFRDGNWKRMCGSAPLHITGILEYKKDTLLVTTQKDGLFLLSGQRLIPKRTPIDGLLKDNLINSGKKLGEDRYALGTVTGGVLIIDGDGNMIERFSTGEGLPDNNVQSMFTDREGNLWLGLQNGIALVHYATTVRLIKPVRDNQLVGNTVRVFDHRLYIGTSNGLYSLALDPAVTDMSRLKGRFTEVENTKGQVWGLQEMGGDLLVGHQDGASVVQGDRATAVPSGMGVWGFLPLGEGSLIAGTYTGLVRMTDSGGHWEERGKVNGLYESLPVFAYDGRQTIWASHPYRGVFRNPLSGPFKHYGVAEGLPSLRSNYIVAWKDKILAATEKGIYEYDPAADRFRPAQMFRPIFGDTSVEYLRPDREGNIWFVSDQRVGVIDYGKPSGQAPYSVVYFPGLKGQTVKGFTTVYPYDKENVFIGSNNGMFHLNYNRYLESAGKVRVLLGRVEAIAERDSLLYGGYESTLRPARLPNRWNSFHFEYASPMFTQPNTIEYSYQLEGFDREWSEWSAKPEKDYTNLSTGEYRFRVRARDNLGNVSEAAEFPFAVEAAWYQGGWAWLGYLLLAAGVFWLIRRRQERRLMLHQKKYEEEQARRNYLHSLELDRKEKGMIALQNAKLEGELQWKNKELATATMHLVERGGILSSIKEELTAVIKRLNNPGLNQEFKPVFRMINDTEKSDEDWNRFAVYFDEVHNNFLATLKAKYPALSPTDLKLCAYLRLNLSSKEIAQLLNISLKGVEVSRYRLRKKLVLATEINLNDFLGKIS